MEQTIINQLKAAIAGENLADVTRLVSKCSDLNVNFVSYSPIIKEALQSENYDIMHSVLELAFTRYTSPSLKGLLMYRDLYKDKPIAAQIVAAYLVHSHLSKDDFILSQKFFKAFGYPWMGSLLKIKKNRQLVRWLVYILHQSNVLTYDDLVKQPRLLRALVRYHATDLKDVLNARVDYYGTKHTVLYCVIINPYIKYEEKWNLVMDLDRVCSSSRAAPGILNPDLTELAACIVRKYLRLFKFLISKKCPSLDKTIDRVPFDGSAGKNLSHFFAKYASVKDFNQFPSLRKHWLKFFTTSDSKGDYSVNDFLANSGHHLLGSMLFKNLIDAVAIIVRRNKEDIKKLTFIRKSRLYRHDKGLSLFLYQLGFRHRSLLKIAGIPRAPNLKFAATETPTEFPIHELPIDILVLITGNTSMVDIFAVFCMSKKCFSMKTLLLQSSFWSQYFKTQGPFKHAQYLALPKEMCGTYIDYQNSFARGLKQGQLKVVEDIAGESYITALDDNWIIWKNQPNQSISLTNCWNKKFEQQHVNLKAEDVTQATGFVIIESTPTDITFGFAESLGHEYVWHTYRNRTKLSSVSFKSNHEILSRRSIFNNGKVYWGQFIYNFNSEVPSCTEFSPELLEGEEVYLDVNRLTGVAAYSTPTKWFFSDKNDLMMLSCNARMSGQLVFVDEHCFAAVDKEGISYFDLRKLPIEDFQNTKKPDIEFHTAEIIFSAANDRVILKSKYGICAVWNLYSRQFESAFLDDSFAPVFEWNSKYIFGSGSNNTIGTRINRLE